MHTLNYYESPVGLLQIKSNNNQLTRISYASKKSQETTRTELIDKTIDQLENYFLDPTVGFNLPFTLEGTDHQVRVWNALQNIKIGETMTYGELAKICNSSPRAIGNACRSNPLCILIPCHRIIGKKTIGGYSGKTQGSMIDRKTWLLKHESPT